MSVDLTEEVRNGTHDGKIVWVCHYNRPDLNKKPMRNIPPTKCMVVSNDELPAKKTVYYSKSHYRPLGKSGEPTSKIISPVDNTGYRGYCGNMLFTFESEKDCIEEWNEQVNNVYERWGRELDSYRRRIESEMEILSESIILI